MKYSLKKIGSSAAIISLLLVLPILETLTPSVVRAANTATLSISPQSGTFTNGADLSFSVLINLNSQYNAAFADVYFDSNKLQYQSTTIGQSFNGGGNAAIRSNGFGSYISISGARTSGGPLQGRHSLATIRFKARNTGNTYLNFGSRRVVLYPTTEYNTTASNGTYTIVSAPPPPTPTPPPAPTPTPTPPPAPTPPAPKPTPPPAPQPSPVKRPVPKPRAPTSSSPRTPAGRLQINDFSVSNVSYASAELTWKTSTPASSKVNYGTDKSDLYLEQNSDTPTSEHRIILDKTTLKAGTKYFFRITSNDGRGPVTIDGEFTTQFIPVVIRITDLDDKPLNDVEVTVDDLSGTTNEEGESTFELRQGEVTIYASKGEQESEFTATIEVPDEGEPVQTITVVLSGSNSNQDTSSASTSKSNSNAAALRAVVAVIVLVTGSGLLFYLFYWRKRRSTEDQVDIPIAFESSGPPPPPPLPPIQDPPQASTPVHSETPPPSGPVHHATIPELVGRYGPINNDPSGSSATQVPPPSSVVVSPSGTPIPKHTSLKEMIHLPAPNDNKTEPNPIPPTNDLPIAPSSVHKESKKHASDDSLIIPH